MIKSKFPNSYRVYHYTEFLPFWANFLFHVCAREFRFRDHFIEVIPHFGITSSK